MQYWPGEKKDSLHLFKQRTAYKFVSVWLTLDVPLTDRELAQ